MHTLNWELQPSQKRSVVVCPSAKLPAEVTLDAHLEVESCTRWLEDGGCRQTCTPQIRFSSESVEDFVAIYGGRRCSCCNAVLTAQDWYNNRLSALRNTGDAPTRISVLPTDSITGADEKSPVCSDCFLAIH